MGRKEKGTLIIETVKGENPFTYWTDTAVAIKADVEQAVAEGKVTAGDEPFGDNTFQVNVYLGYKIDCSQPIGSRVTIGKYQPIIPILLGTWKYISVTKEDLVHLQYLAQAEQDNCR